MGTLKNTEEEKQKSCNPAKLTSKPGLQDPTTIGIQCGQIAFMEIKV
jgi:hypothetical protein